MQAATTAGLSATSKNLDRSGSACVVVPISGKHFRSEKFGDR